MSKIRLQFVQSFVDQHGKPRFYFRRRGQRRVALLGLPGSSNSWKRTSGRSTVCDFFTMRSE